MIERDYTADRINAIVNDPAVRPWVADVAAGPIDMTAEVANPANVCLVGRYGAFFCFKFWDGLYECHSQMLPDGRGKWAFDFARAGARYMFTATDCAEILTRIPEGHVAATALARAMGFSLQFTTLPECLFRSRRVPCAIHSLSLQDWVRRSGGLEERGADFHDWLNTQCHGTPHEPDADHNRIVGAALSMIEAGQVRKGVLFYNRYAFAARHQPIVLLGEDPPRIKFDAGVLTMKNGEILLETVDG